MYSVYNTIILVVGFALRLLHKAKLIPTNTAAGQFISGQKGVINRFFESVNYSTPTKKPRIWIHASSLGEYGVVRPIVKQLDELNKYDIILTFFSPTGVNALSTNHPYIQYVDYLPLDSYENAKSFIQIIKPEKALFSVSEFWPNYLRVLKELNIPTYLIAGHITKTHPVFNPIYGSLFKTALKGFTSFLVLDKESQNNLQFAGFNNSVLIGDPLFDNVITCASTSYHDPIIESFVKQKNAPVFIAGSISDDKDLDLVSYLANKYTDVPFIFVPHVISPENINKTIAAIKGYAIPYSECSKEENFQDIQVLIIDFLGALAYIYRYCTWAYVGGGFTPYLHSIMEAVVYGLPVSFGPNINRKITPQHTINLGIGTIVKKKKDIDTWFSAIKDNSKEIERIKTTAQQYAYQNGGATKQILTLINA